MVEIDVIIAAAAKEVEKFGVSAQTAAKYGEHLKTVMSGVASMSFSNISNILGGLNDRLRGVVGSAEQLKNANYQVGQTFDNLSKSVGTFLTLTTKFDAFKGLQIQSGTAISTMGNQFDEFVGRFGGWEKASRELSARGFSSLVSLGAEGAQRMLDAASSAQKLETNYTNLLAASGRLGSVFNAQNEITGSLRNETIAYGTELLNTSAITGESLKTVADLSSSLKDIPGILGTMTESADGSGEKINVLSKVMQVARGVGIGYGEALKNMKVGFELLGQAQGKVTDSAEKGLQMMSLMSEALKVGGLRLEDTEGYLTTVATQFRLVGDNTQAAVNVLGRFSGALQQTGLTGKASLEVVQNMVQAVGKLEMGTKALISMRTGGAGGLQGAFQVENLIRQGKVDEVAKMMEQTLRRQFGGRIYSQEDAARSPQAASEFMRQRTMLTSGAFGGLAKDNESASRLLEAIKSGPASTAQEIKNATEATKDAAQRGQSLQEHQLTVLNMLNNSMDRMVALGEIQLLKDAREVIGTGHEDYNNMLRQSLRSYTQSALEDQRRTPTPDTSPNAYADNMRLSQDKMALSQLGASMGIMPNMFGKMGDMVTKGADMGAQLVNSYKEKSSRDKLMKDVETQTMRSESMQAGNRGLGPATARAAEMVKQEITTKSQVELNLKVESPDGLRITGEATSSDANLITNFNAAASTGMNTVRK